MILIMFFEFLIGLTDIYIAGRVGKEIQATYGFVIQLYFVFIILANAITAGTVSVVSRLFTAGDKNILNNAVYSTVVTTVISGVIFRCCRYFFYTSSDHFCQHSDRAETIRCPPRKDIRGRALISLYRDQYKRHTPRL